MFKIFKVFKKVYFSDRPDRPFEDYFVKDYPHLKNTYPFVRWELSRAVLRLRISIIKAFRDDFRRIKKKRFF